VQILGIGLICPKGSNILRAEIQRALRRAPRQLRRLARLANSPGFKSFRCPRERIKFSLERFSDQSRTCLRAQPLESSLGRVPKAPRFSHALRLEMGNNCRKTTRVAHFRGSTLQCLRASACVPSRWKVLSGEFRRRPTALVIKFRKPDRVGRRGLSEPREDFPRLPTDAFPWLYSWLFPWLFP
jgi:hypothetical protein